MPKVDMGNLADLRRRNKVGLAPSDKEESNAPSAAEVAQKIKNIAIDPVSNKVNPVMMKLADPSIGLSPADKVTSPTPDEPQGRGSDMLSTALIGLLPGVLGAIFGGSEAGAEASKGGVVGVQMLEEERKRQEDMRFKASQAELDRQDKLTTQSKRKIDLNSQLVKKGTEIPVFTRESESGGVELVTSEGEIIKSTDVENLQLVRDRNISERQEKGIEFGKEKLGQFSGTQVDKLSAYDTSLDQMNGIAGKIESQAKGLVGGLTTEFKLKLKQGGAEEAAFDTQLGLLKQEVTKAFHGGRPTEKDLEVVSSLIGDIKENPENLKARLGQLKSLIEINKRNFLDSIKKGQSFKSDSVSRFSSDATSESGDVVSNSKSVEQVSNKSPAELAQEKKNKILSRIKK